MGTQNYKYNKRDEGPNVKFNLAFESVHLKKFTLFQAAVPRLRSGYVLKKKFVFSGLTPEIFAPLRNPLR